MTYINLPSAVADDMIDVVGVVGTYCAVVGCNNVAVAVLGTAAGGLPADAGRARRGAAYGPPAADAVPYPATDAVGRDRGTERGAERGVRAWGGRRGVAGELVRAWRTSVNRSWKIHT